MEGFDKMVDGRRWANELKEKLISAFGERLLFVGFQGSCKRGEATEESDIDVVTILDRLELDDLKIYRSLVQGMPDREKACGFVAGKSEMASWPKHEIFQMEQETEALYGSLEGLLPAVGRADAEESVRIAASGLYHMLCHTYLYGSDEEKEAVLKATYKSTFFILQLLHYLATGTYCGTKAELLEALSGERRQLLEANIESKRTDFKTDTDAHFERLIRWTSDTMREIPARP